jgi:molybdopterin adenylyltransferase
MTIRIGIVTVSDRSSSGERPDASGPALSEVVFQQGWHVIRTLIVPDEIDQLEACLIEWADSAEMDVILTTGGTGLSMRDITPEATTAVIQRPCPGLAEAMRNASLKSTPHAMLSRATAGIRARTLIINLPGSPKAAIENFAVLIPVIPHAVQQLQGDPATEAGHHAI